MKPSATLLCLLASATFTTGVMADDAPFKKSGDILVNQAGMTLYTFDKDAVGSGKSNCNDACAGLWPPVMATATSSGSGDYSVISRDDGSKQWAVKGKPVYLFSKDKQMGDRTGDNVKDVWHVIKN
ncbi:hypothetical protein BH11PSE12_BH11PSE12_31640 [soil metagenome]